MRRAVGLALLFGAALAVAISADVIVTTDGTVIETDGGWERRGRVIVFTRAGGGLEALRVDDVDFEATERRRLAEPAAQTQPASAQPKKARIVITDSDVAHSPASSEEVATVDARAGGTESADGTPAETTAAPTTSTGVRVIAWDDDEPADGEGRRVFGTLRNDGNSFAADISVEVSVFDNDGAVVGTQRTDPVRKSLRPGESTTFSLQFRDAYSLGAVKTTVSSLDLDLGQSPPPRPDDSPPDG